MASDANPPVPDSGETNADFTDMFQACVDGYLKQRGLTQAGLAEKIRDLQASRGAGRSEAGRSLTGWTNRISAWCTGTLPENKKQLFLVLTVLGVPSARHAKWGELLDAARAARQSEQRRSRRAASAAAKRTQPRGAGASGPGPAPDRRPQVLGVPVKQAFAAGPVEYEVHPAIRLSGPGLTGPDADAGAERMPVYVPRDHDTKLADVVEAAVVGTSRVAVLVGGSSTGKTRACWEAVKQLPSEWRVWHPLTVAELMAGLADEEGGTKPTARTVIWLNELQRYLPGGTSTEATAVALRNLLRDRGRRPVLILATIWPDSDRWGVLVTDPGSGQPDPHEQARHLLTGAEIAVPDGIAEGYAGAVAAADEDPLWREAMAQAPDRPIQFIAGARYLQHRYKTGTPAQRAVLEAAVDARRLGGPLQLSLAFLEQAAQDYLPDDAWHALPADQQTTWVRDAIHDRGDGLSIPGRGVPGPLHPPRKSQAAGPVYEVAEFLEQHLAAQRRAALVRTSLWDALADHIADPENLEHLGDAAAHRLLYRQAERLYRKADTEGATYALSRLLQDRGLPEEAVAILRAGMESGQHLELGLGSLLTSLDRLDEAIPLFKRAAERGNDRARAELARQFGFAGRLDEALAQWQIFYADGPDARTRRKITDIYLQQSRPDDAIALLGPLADQDQLYARSDLVSILVDNDRGGQAELLLRAWAADGDSGAARDLAHLLAKWHRVPELRELAERGSEPARWELIRLLVAQGDTSEAARTLHAADPDGDEFGWSLPQLLGGAGYVEEAAALFRSYHRKHPENDDSRALLAGLLAESGCPQCLQELTQRADDGDSRAAQALAPWLLKHRPAALWERARHGEWDACRVLSDWLTEQGRGDEAIPLWQARVERDAKDGWSRSHLTRLLIAHGRGEEALSLLHETARNDSTRKHRHQRAYYQALLDLAEADELRRLVTNGDEAAESSLAELLSRQNPLGEEMRLLFVTGRGNALGNLRAEALRSSDSPANQILCRGLTVEGCLSDNDELPRPR